MDFWFEHKAGFGMRKQHRTGVAGTISWAITTQVTETDVLLLLIENYQSENALALIFDATSWQPALIVKFSRQALGF